MEGKHETAEADEKRVCPLINKLKDDAKGSGKSPERQFKPTCQCVLSFLLFSLSWIVRGDILTGHT